MMIAAYILGTIATVILLVISTRQNDESQRTARKRLSDWISGKGDG
jgi:hypothetical protein